MRDVTTVSLTVWGLIIATRGLAAWKKQLRGTKEFDAGYNLQYSLLKLRDAIKHVRNPAIWPSESDQALQYAKNKYPNKTEEERLKESSAYVYEMRWDEIANAATEMESHLLAAEVLWGRDIHRLLVPLRKKIAELNIALKRMFGPVELRGGKEMTIFDIVYDQGDWSSDKEDKFGEEVNSAIKTITDYIKEKIS